jgi:hypothetical protein
MAGNFENYTNLKELVSDYLGRDDLADKIPIFIQLGEQRLRRDLRLRQMLKYSTATLQGSDATIAIPNDFLAIKTIYLDTNPINTLEYQTSATFYDNPVVKQTGQPSYYTLIGSEFQFAPIPAGDYTLKMIYYFRPEVLSSSNASNVFLLYAPDLLLYASLAEAEPYLMNDERLQTWSALYTRGLESLSKSDDESEYPSTPLTIQLKSR